MHGGDFAAALVQLRSFSARQLCVAFACVAISILLGGLYEAGAVRYAGRSLGLARPFIVATIANAVGHTLGFSTLSGGALRYRFYARFGLRNAQIGAVVFMSAMPFLFGSWVLLSLALMIDARLAAAALHVPVELSRVAGCAGVALSIVYLGLVSAHRQSLSFGKFQFKLPSLALSLQQFALGAAEIFAVASVLYVFMPAELGMGSFGFLIVYLIAVLLAQLSSVPAGLGVLEASLILMLPQVPADKLIGAVIAYRVMFEVVPVVIAFVLYVYCEWRCRE